MTNHFSVINLPESNIRRYTLHLLKKPLTISSTVFVNVAFIAGHTLYDFGFFLFFISLNWILLPDGTMNSVGDDEQIFSFAETAAVNFSSAKTKISAFFAYPYL